MNARVTAAGLTQKIHRILGMMILFLPTLANAAPLVVSVDHRVSVSYSAPQLDARKGVYITHVRIKNRSAAALHAPLMLAFDQASLKGIHLLNARDAGKDGRPYFEFALSKELLAAGAVTEPLKVIFVAEKVSTDVPKADAKENTANKVMLLLTSAQHVSAGVETALLEPRAEPYALKADSGKVDVRFSVPLVGRKVSAGAVYFRRVGDRTQILLNDQGKNGDLIANDGIFGANIAIDTTELKPDTCQAYQAFTRIGKTEMVSPAAKLCVSSFPVRMTAPKTKQPLVLPDGSKVVADEILVNFRPDTSAATIREIASSMNAQIAGSILPLNYYQFRLAEAVSAARMAELVAQIRLHAEVEAASPNAIGEFAYTPSDTSYANQQGLQRVRAQDVWDIGAVGTGVIVTVLDTGIDRGHPDFGTVGNCQLAENDCGSPNTDASADGHGTGVAGIIAAKTNNALGVAGVAYGSRIHSIVVNSANLAGMTQGFTDAASYGVASVINASFSGGPWNGAIFNAGVSNLCTAINTAVLNGVTPRALVVNAAGNNALDTLPHPYTPADYYYPSACNNTVRPEHGQLTQKGLFITVANSASVVVPACGSVALDQRCSDSNYNSWTDIAAPGSAIYTTTLTSLAGGYDYRSGTSFAAPHVAAAGAILRACGVPLDQVESTLRTSANVTVPFPDGSSAPRLDIYRAMMQRNHAPTAINLSNNSLNEHINTAGGYDVGTLSAVDADTCDKFTFSVVGGADAASFSINAATNTLRINAGVLNYAVKPNYAVTVRVTDFFGATFDQPLTVNVINLNDPPTGVVLSNTVTSTPENGVNIKVADISVIDDALGTNTLYLSGPDWVSFSIVGSALYFNGGADFETKNTYNVTVNVDDLSVGATPDASQGFVLAITNVNEAPVANNDMLTASQNTPVTYTAAQLLGNDTDVDTGTVLSIANVTSGVGGTVVLNGDGTVTFTPTMGFSGAASFTYRATDGSLNSNVATVAVNVAAAVNHAPVANNDTLSATEDVPVTYAATQFLGNDTDVDVGTTLAIANVASGTGGTVMLNGGGTVTFTPNPNFNGAATFTYTATDGGLTSNVATVTVNVAAVNDAPTGVPIINGNRTVGQTLTADPSPIGDVDGLGAFHYQWKRDGANVGTDSNSYTLVSADFGGFMSLCVSYTDGGGTPETVCSANDAVAVGDPHITTVDGLYYDFQSAGEFVSLRDASGMEIQVRQTPVSAAMPLTDSNSGLTSGVSVNSALAARVGKHRVTYQADPGNAANGAPVLRVDGVVTNLTADGIDFGDGGRVTPQGSGIQIDFPDHTTLIASASQWAPYNVWWLQMSVFHTSAYEGLMGARLKGSWLPRLSNGSALGARPVAMHDRYVELYVKFADSWRVNKETSLFDYANGTSTATFTNKAWPTENGPFVAGSGPIAKPLARKAALLACRDVAGKNENAGCVFDVMVVGNKDIAKAHLLNQNVRVGATNVIVRGTGRPDAHGEMVFTATVARQATVVPKELNVRAVPAGMIQFMINGEKAGKPVKLDGKGQANWKVPYQRFFRQKVTAQYIPAKGTAFLPSSAIVRNALVLEKR